MKRVAICLRGAVAKVSGAFFTPDSLYSTNQYVNINAVYNSIVRHIIEPNKDCSFDFYIHSWSLDLQTELNKLYSPIKSLFESNLDFKDKIQERVIRSDDYRGLSQALAIQRSLSLCNLDEYDCVILYRPDILIWKDISMAKYDLDVVTTNAHNTGNGDFHFVMSSALAKNFANLFDSAPQNPHYPHFWIKNYVENFMKVPAVSDDIIPGRDQEVIRKIYSISHNIHHVPIETFMSYGLTINEILQYNSLP